MTPFFSFYWSGLDLPTFTVHIPNTHQRETPVTRPLPIYAMVTSLMLERYSGFLTIWSRNLCRLAFFMSCVKRRCDGSKYHSCYEIDFVKKIFTIVVIIHLYSERSAFYPAVASISVILQLAYIEGVFEAFQIDDGHNK